MISGSAKFAVGGIGTAALIAIATSRHQDMREIRRGGRGAQERSLLDRDWGGSGSPVGLSPAERQLAVRGIKNLGNTCFLNAVLQSLGSFPVFREYLQALSPRPPLASSAFTYELLQIMNELNPRMPPAPPLPPIIPSKLRKLLRDRVDMFGKEDQQDAQELFQMVMRLVGEETALCLKNCDKARGGPPDMGGTGGLRDLMDDCSPRHDSGDGVPQDVPENPLLGSLMYLRHCRGCRQKSGRLERFVDLSLTLPEARNHVVGPGMRSAPVELGKILQDFTQEQLVEDVECPKCAMRSAMEAHDAEVHNEQSEGSEEETHDEDESEEEEVVVPPTRVRADMRILLATPPKTLCLHFPRRHQSPSGFEMKLKQRVIFPMRLNVAPFCYTGGYHTDSIGVPTAFQMNGTLASSLPQLRQLPPGRTVKTPPGAGLPSDSLFPTSQSAASPPLAKALQSPQSHHGVKQALVGGSAGIGNSAGSRKVLNGLPNGSGARTGGSSASGSVEGRDSMDGSVSGNDGGMEYDLRAVIVHRGNADSGHYTAFRKLDLGEEQPVEAPQGGGRVLEAPHGEGKGEGVAKKEWVYISDEEVERVSEKKVLSSQAYMLFYRQRISEVLNHGLG